MKRWTARVLFVAPAITIGLFGAALDAANASADASPPTSVDVVASAPTTAYEAVPASMPPVRITPISVPPEQPANSAVAAPTATLTQTLVLTILPAP